MAVDEGCPAMGNLDSARCALPISSVMTAEDAEKSIIVILIRCPADDSNIQGWFLLPQ